MSLDQLRRKLRFAPKMGGNREMVALPCAFVSQLIYLFQFHADEGSSATMDGLAAELLKKPIEITTK
jgi:hypothetical protein